MARYKLDYMCSDEPDYAEHVGDPEAIAWATGELEPFAAYERDKVHLCVRSIISRRRDQRAKHSKTNEDQQEYRRARRGPFDLTAHMDLSMLGAYSELRPLWPGVVAGTLSEHDYAALKQEAFRKHGLEK
jgi:hypothetical protein